MNSKRTASDVVEEVMARGSGVYEEVNAGGVAVVKKAHGGEAEDGASTGRGGAGRWRRWCSWRWSW